MKLLDFFNYAEEACYPTSNAPCSRKYCLRGPESFTTVSSHQHPWHCPWRVTFPEEYAFALKHGWITPKLPVNNIYFTTQKYCMHITLLGYAFRSQLKGDFE